MLIRDMGHAAMMVKCESMGDLEVNILQKTAAPGPSAVKAAIASRVDADPTLKGL